MFNSYVKLLEGIACSWGSMYNFGGADLGELDPCYSFYVHPCLEPSEKCGTETQVDEHGTMETCGSSFSWSLCECHASIFRGNANGPAYRAYRF